ncbi:putative Ig domain-containing protein [Burkholderia pyrrocinia]|uniref:putative Ig domain-containing protein n=1 Tax=Burkholderia pyrrocinia TaxID=60550 RepID=UPI003D768D5D
MTSAAQPPASLAYADMVYSVGRVIPANRPQATGGAITAYGVSPALPDGLSLDVQTGWIAGTPRQAQRETTYVRGGR